MAQRAPRLALLCLLAAAILFILLPNALQTKPPRDRPANEMDAPGLRGRSPSPAPPEATRDLTPVTQALASGEATRVAAAVEALRARFAALSPRQLLEIAFLPPMEGEAETLRRRALVALERATGRLRPVVQVVLAAVVGEDAHERDVATSILCAHCGGTMVRRAQAQPCLRPADLAAVRLALTSDVCPVRAKRSLLMSMGELGPEALSLLPLVPRFLAEERTSIERRREVQRRSGILVLGGNEDSVVRLAFAIADLGAPAVPALVDWLDEPGWGMGRTAAVALEWMGDPAAPALLEALGSSNPLVRRRAAGALAGVEKEAVRVLEALERAQHDADPDVRAAVSESRASLGGDDGLVSQLRSENADVRWAAVEGMGDALKASADQEVVDALLQLAPEFAWRREAGWYAYVRLLARLGPRAAPAVPHVLRRLLLERGHRTLTPRPGAVFRAMGEPAALPIVRALLGDDPRLASVAAAALAALDAVDAESRRRLAAHLETHPDTPHAVVMAGALVPTQSRERGVPVLVRALREGGDWDQRSQAAAGLGRLGRAGLPYLQELADLLVALDAEFERRREAGGWWTEGITYEVRVDTALRAVGAHDLPRVIGWLDHPASGDLRQVARETLESDARSTELLLDAWPTLGGGGRWHALKSLQRLREDGPARARLLDLGLDDADPRVRLMAIGLVPSEGPRLARAIDVGIAMALGTDEDVAVRALFELGQLSDSAAVLAAVRPHADHADPQVRARIRALLDRIEDRRRGAVGGTGR